MARAVKMSQPESDPGTGVKEVIDLLLKAPSDRLRSLTYQLGPSAEENIVHALCLFILQKQVEALEKLQICKNNILAKYLSEKWQRDTSNIENLRVLCENFQESNSVLTLARIFKVLTDHRLCKKDLLNLAYKRALPHESSDSTVLEYNYIMEEAKQACGPEIVDILGIKNLKLESEFPSKSDKSNTSGTTGLADVSIEDPSSLRSASSSFPSELEISFPPTSLPGISSHVTVNPYQPSKSISKPQEEPLEAAATEESEEEEEKFYSFVILHAQEDEDMAVNMKEKVEKIIQSEGATYSGEFEVSGKIPIRCMDDAINNSAFALLLLTKNFNSFLELKANTALINSIENPSKRDTVIPLSPESNAMPKADFPMVLRTLNPLVENRHFETKIRQALKPGKIKRQKEVWTKKKELKRLNEKKKRLEISNQLQQMENREYRAMLMLRQEHQNLMYERNNIVLQQFDPNNPDGRPLLQPQHINISNAQYVLIGNDSRMAVNLSGSEPENNRYEQ